MNKHMDTNRKLVAKKEIGVGTDKRAHFFVHTHMYASMYGCMYAGLVCIGMYTTYFFVLCMLYLPDCIT